MFAPRTCTVYPSGSCAVPLCLNPDLFAAEARESGIQDPSLRRLRNLLRQIPTQTAPDTPSMALSVEETLLCSNLLRVAESVTRLQAASSPEPDTWLAVVQKMRELANACAAKVSCCLYQPHAALLLHCTNSVLYTVAQKVLQLADACAARVSCFPYQFPHASLLFHFLLCC